MNEETFSEVSSVKSNNSELEEMTEVYLPRTEKIIPFFSLSDEDKRKVIELGLCFLHSGNKRNQFWNNKEWETKISEIEKDNENEVSNLQSQIHKEKQNSVFIVEQFRQQKEILTAEVRENTEIKYKKEIEDLKQNNELMQQQIAKQNNEYRELHMTLSDKYDSKMDQIRENHEKKQQEMEERMERYKSQYEDSLIRTQNSTIKGQDGEEFTYHQLNRLFPKAEIEDCHKQTGKCDFIMRQGDFSMMLEIKNYKTNVNKAEIDKFYRDIDSEQNNDIKCAILISLKSGVCNKKDFDFEIRNGKPIMFLHNISSNMINITVAFKFLNMVLHQKDIDLTNQEVVDCFRNLASTIKRSFTKQRKQIEKFSSEQINLIAEQETNIQKLFGILNQKF